jgi:hypothetical protein
VLPISSGGLNGYSNVTRAGTPTAAEGSQRSRNGLTKASAPGANTTSADSIDGAYPTDPLSI